MSNNWLNFLNNNATFNTAREVSFSSIDKKLIKNTLFTGELFITDLSYLGLIEVTGDDSKTFLQGQLTNDINAVSAEKSQLSGLCSPKGRLKALFSIFTNNSANKLYLQLPYPLIDETLKRLKMFVMMSKVTLTDVSDELVKIGVYGDAAEQHLKQYGFNIPKQPGMVAQYNDMQLIRLHADKARFECVGNTDAIQKLWLTLHAEAQLLNTEHWKLLDIYAALPNVYSSSKEAFIPQMLNLQVLNGISFKKGCYTGQEIVARMEYLGKLKRRMYLARCETIDSCEIRALPLPGDSLYSASVKTSQGTGNIVEAQADSSGNISLLAVISNDAVAQDDVFLDEQLQHKLIIQDMPYSIE